jgi:hypothetical protein
LFAFAQIIVEHFNWQLKCKSFVRVKIHISMNDFVGNVQHAVDHAVAVIASGADVEKVCQQSIGR